MRIKFSPFRYEKMIVRKISDARTAAYAENLRMKVFYDTWVDLESRWFRLDNVVKNKISAFVLDEN